MEDEATSSSVAAERRVLEEVVETCFCCWKKADFSAPKTPLLLLLVVLTGANDDCWGAI